MRKVFHRDQPALLLATPHKFLRDLLRRATDAVRAGFIEDNVLYRTLARFPEQVTWRRLELDREQPLGGAGARLSITALAAPGKRPLHLEATRAASAKRAAKRSAHAV